MKETRLMLKSINNINLISNQKTKFDVSSLRKMFVLPVNLFYFSKQIIEDIVFQMLNDSVHLYQYCQLVKANTFPLEHIFNNSPLHVVSVKTLKYPNPFVLTFTT